MLATTAFGGLDQAECWRLLGWAHLGRLAARSGDRIEIFPVNFIVRDQSILFRSAGGTKLAAIAEHPEVAFEIDGEDSRWHWSVVVHGRAERIVGDVEIMKSGVLELVSWSPTDKFNYVRLTPDAITGRRIDRHEFRRSSMVG